MVLNPIRWKALQELEVEMVRRIESAMLNQPDWKWHPVPDEKSSRWFITNETIAVWDDGTVSVDGCECPIGWSARRILRRATLEWKRLNLEGAVEQCMRKR